MRRFVVAPQNTGAGQQVAADFYGLQNAFNAIMQISGITSVYLKLLPGIYEGQFNFCGKRKQDTDIVIRIKGSGKNKTIIRGNLGGFDQLEDGKRGTFRSYTLRISGSSAWLENLTVENTSGLPYPAGRGRDAGQAIALYVAADRFFCRNVRVAGHQDTLFAAPLPEKVRESGGFRGPDENSPRVPSVHIYRYCEISGTIDFIFGGAAALFYRCRLNVRPLLPKSGIGKENRYIAAPCSEKFFQTTGCLDSGFVFYRCNVSVEEPSSVPVYLARPWRPYGRCFFVCCTLADGISSDLWHIWNQETDKITSFFVSYGNTGVPVQVCQRNGSPCEKKVDRAVLFKIIKNLRNCAKRQYSSCCSRNSL